jgi:tetratricopeptide (TPR) repeat protein
MNRSVRVLASIAALALLFAGLGCSKLRARDQLNKGVQSFKNAKYEEAIEHFKNAVSLDPSLLTARLYLGTAYMQQFVPGVDSPENDRYAASAVDEFKSVLAESSTNRENRLHALKSIASLYYNKKEFDKAIDFYRQAAQLDPNDPETYYMLGVISWADTYNTAAIAKGKIALKVDDEFRKDKAHAKDDQQVCQQLKSTNGPKVDAGLDALDKALKLRQDYEDAMAYMNLLYRRKADVECGNPEGRATDIKSADMWSDKAMDIRKEKLKKQDQGQPGGIVLEQGQQQGAK